MKNKFVTGAGWLTPYALACGYMEISDPEDGTRITLSKDPHGNFYRVRCGRDGFTTKSLVAARKVFREYCKIHGQTKRKNFLSSV